MKFAIINGPNLNLLGKREPEIYGTQSFEEYLKILRDLFPKIEIHYYQSNVEGELINEVQKLGFEYDGLVINAGAYTHTSIAIGDAIASVPAATIEVHITNIFARESFRHHSYISPHAIAVICGLGLDGYQYAIEQLIQNKI